VKVEAAMVIHPKSKGQNTLLITTAEQTGKEYGVGEI
jgi:hypothetical protein